MNPGNAQRKQTAIELLKVAGVDMAADFHALSTDQVLKVLEVANACRYREPKSASGSRARCFFEYLNRTRKTATEYVVQGYYATGWEDECSADTRKVAREDLKAYRDNCPNTFRIITRRVRLDK